MQNYYKLEAKMARVQSLRDAAAILNWDSSVSMPESAASYRADQMAAITESAFGLVKDNDNLSAEYIKEYCAFIKLFIFDNS